MRPVLTIAIKDLRLMLRDRPGLLFTVLFPLLFGLFFGAIYADSASGDQRPLAIALSVEPTDEPSWADDFARAVEANPRLEVRRFSGPEATEAALRGGSVVAELRLPEGFGAWFESVGVPESGAPVLRFGPGVLAETELLRGLVTGTLYETLLRSFSEEDASERRRRALLDLAAESSTPVSEALRLRAAAAAIQSMRANAETSEEAPRFAIEVDTGSLQAQAGRPRNSFAITFPQAIMWAVLGCAATFAVSLVGERASGTLTRLRLMPIGSAQILAGKGLACASVSFCVALAFVGLGHAFFGVRPVSYPLLLLALVCVSFAFAGLMMLLAVLGKSKTSPGQLAWGVILIMAITGGGMLPLFFMPDWLLSISHLSPVKWGIFAIESGIWRETTPGEVVLSLGVLVGIGAFGFVVGAKAFVLSERLANG